MTLNEMAATEKKPWLTVSKCFINNDLTLALSSLLANIELLIVLYRSL